MNRNFKLFSILAVAFALALSMALAGCGQQASSSAASASAGSTSASTSATASSASASATTNEVTFTMKVDATEANQGMLYDGGGTVEKGVTVYQALVDTDLPLAVDSSSGSAYVYGVGDAIVNDSKAGWLFFVNGKTPSEGADKVVIADGDAIEWKYFADYSTAM